MCVRHPDSFHVRDSSFICSFTLEGSENATNVPLLAICLTGDP